MEPQSQLAPPVVAVVVVHDPGEWFDDTLRAFARQDYPNVRHLFLVTPATSPAAPDTDEPDHPPVDVAALIHTHLPSAFVRTLDADVGFGPAVNEVLRLVEGDNGFFLVCHDDVAPSPDALRQLVEELYRSNAGAVGPKLVEWDAPNVLQAVGLGMDRFGEINPVIEPGEVDQEQHDGVRDVFVLPSAFLLVRADLFRTLGGFDPAIDFHGEDAELCWRIHHSGARVVVVPSAVVRHRGALAQRRPDLRHGVLAQRHRMRSVATLTGGSRLPARSVELVALTFVELVVGLFTARFGEAWHSLRGLLGLVPRTPALLARRREVRPIRQVPEREVYSLQERGSARLNSYLRSRETETYVGGADTHVRRWRQSATAPVVAWIVVLLGLVVGARSFIGTGVPPVGEFLPFPESPADLARTFLSGWNPTGAGATSPNPTGWGTLSVASVLTLFHMGLLQTAFVLGLVVLGVSGVWRVAAVFPSTRARVAALAVYAASPLVSGAMSAGRLTVLIAFAATPWVVHLARRAAGIETADPRVDVGELADGLVALTVDERIRRTVVLAVALGLAVAFAPVVLPLAAAIVSVLALATLVAQASWRTAGWIVVTGLGGCVGAAALNLPWITSWTWVGVTGASPIGDAGLGLAALASFEIGSTDFAGLALALYLPVITAVALARGSRLTWAVRGGVLVVVFGALAVLADRGSWPFAAPEAGVLLAPVAVGLSISAAAALAAFDLDVRGATFGWRQPLGIVTTAAVVVGLAPGVGALVDGSFQTPTTPLARLLDASLPDDADGDYNILLVGDARILPVPATPYRDGVSWAIVDDGPLDARDRWMPPPDEAAELVTTALDQMAAASTLRAGRLLAPLGIRYVVVPEFDGVVSTVNEPLALPIGLIDALEDQLDLVAIRPSLPTIDAFENRTWIARQAELRGPTAAASTAAGAEVLVRSDLSDSSPVFVGADAIDVATDQVAAGVVAVAVPFSPEWKLTVGGEPVPARRAFGATTAFDVPTGGTAELHYDTPGLRPFLLALQVVLWAGALAIAGRVRIPLVRRQPGLVDDDTVIDLTAEPDPGLYDPGLYAELAGLDDEHTARTGSDPSPDAADADEAGEADEAGGDADEAGDEASDGDGAEVAP